MGIEGSALKDRRAGTRRVERRGRETAGRRRNGASAREYVLDVKPTLPKLPRVLVERPRLFDALDAGFASRALTLVSAPAAAGKTVLLASWLRSRAPGAVAWVSLHPREEAPFWAQVAEASRRALPSQTVLPHANGRARTFVDRFLEGVEALDEPLVLVVDGLHTLSPRTVDDLDQVLRAAPASLRLVAASRFDPPLHLARLTGELAEIRARDLSFTTEEAAELFAQMGLDLDESAVAATVKRTEGWAGGLALFGLALERRQDSSTLVGRFALDERPAMEYLAAEVLAAQGDDVRDFLLRTSIVDMLDGSLADALTGRDDGARTLEALYRNNVFLDELETIEPVYRYHSLFGDLLRAEAHAEIRDELPDLHDRAARWLARRGHTVAAVRHAIDARSWDLVGELLARHWDAFVASSDIGAATSLLERVPRPQALASPVLAAFAALLRLLEGDTHRAGALLDEAEARAELQGAARSEGLYRYARILALRAQGDVTAAAALAAEQVDRSPVEASGSSAEDRLRALGLAVLGATRIWQGAFDEAQVLLEEAAHLAQEASVVPAEIDARAHLGLLELGAGRVRRAARLARMALDKAEMYGAADSPGTTIAHVTGALAEYQWGDLEAAAASAARAEASARTTGDVLGRILAAAVVAAIAVSRGGDEADEALLHLRAARRRMPQAAAALLDGQVVALEARLLGATARLEEALEIAANHERDPGSALAIARLRLARNEPELGLAALALAGEGSWYTTLEAHVTEAVARDMLSDRAGARASLAAALDLAAPEAIRRPFLDAGAAAHGLLVDHVRRTNDHRWLATELIRLLDGREETATAPAELLEQLSERELEVLHYLPSIMSNGDIAAELFVSVNTVKTHVKSIYRKLGATRRYDAVRRARQLRLL